MILSPEPGQSRGGLDAGDVVLFPATLMALEGRPDGKSFRSLRYREPKAPSVGSGDPFGRGQPHPIRICCGGCTRLALHDQETDLFSCPIHGKIVSVCGLSPGQAEYRFGRPGQIELQGRDLHIGEQSYSGGGEDQIYCQSNGYRYIVYNRTLRTGFGADGHNDSQSASGLVVEKGGRTVSSTRCGGEGDQPVKTGEGERFTPTGGFVDH